jgi:tetratricopeptide (TPR) repeat protein
MLLTTAAGAWGQIPGQVDPRSSEHAVFFSGQAMLDDGSAPADAVLIQRVCGGRTSFAAWTDTLGRFSFKVDAGGSDQTSGDATQTNAPSADLNKPFGNSTQYSNPITSALRDCELEAVLSGYRSERVKMGIKSTMDDTRVGTILLHPLSRASSLIVSATTLAAPANARKAYEKGLEAIRGQQWNAAGGEFEKAVRAYPKFAIAWYQLGLVRQNLKDIPGAVAAWRESVASDPKYLKPYESLTVLADRQGDWAESEKYSRAWIQLDPEDFPGAYVFNAVANAKLNNMEGAEHAAREGLRVDKERKVARLSYVLGLILAQKREYAESAKLFRAYLELAPNAADAAIVRQQLPQIEQAAGGSPR